MKKIICFDLDDTLIDSDYKFEFTFCDCIKSILMSFETRAPQIDEVLEYARNLDNEKLANYSPETRYQPERLYDTWLETYAYFCEKREVSQKSHVKFQIKGIIGQNFDSPWYIIPGAAEVLEILSSRKDLELKVLTVGNQIVQYRKLTSTGLDKHFKHIEVTTGDKQAFLELQAKISGADNVYMIGNSVRSDINPALRSGVKAIHIPRGSWHHFQEDTIHTEYTVLNDIRDLVDFQF